MSNFTVYEQRYPFPSGLPFRIVENVTTCDGVRSRLSHECFRTFEEALAWVMDRADSNKPFTEIPA